jgi:uroporphyrin-3 C-methyltransferase
MTEPSSAPSSPAPAPAKAARARLALSVAGVLALLALTMAMGLWIYTTRQIHALETELAKRLSAFDTRTSESRLLAGQAQESVRELAVKVAVLEQNLQQSRDQQLALEALYQELARGRDEATLAEIEQLVYFASQQLQLSGNVKAALIALQTAESRLARVDKPQFHTLRKVIAKDIERLRLSPAVDTSGISLKLDDLIERIDELPLLPAARSAHPRTDGRAQPAAEPLWKRLASELWADFRQLVRVQDTGRLELPLLPPDQAYYARENLKLRLLAARLSLLAHDEASYRRDLSAARRWLERYFDTGDKAALSAARLMRELEASPVRVDLPDISASIDAVRNFKLVPERSPR